MDERQTPPVSGIEIASSGAVIPTGKSDYWQRAEAEGLDIRWEKQVSRTSQIDLSPHTVYAVGDDLTYDAPVEGAVNDVAIVSRPGERPQMAVKGEDRRRFEVDVHGNGFLWAGIDLDQSAPDAWGRIRAVGDRMTVADTTHQGKGRRANPTPGRAIHATEPELSPGYKAGETFAMSAPRKGETNTLRNVDLVFGGVLDRRHFGDRPIGVFLGRQHKGTLRMQDVRIEEVPNNAIYASAAPGRVEVDGYTAWNNGVTQGRIAHGYFNDFDVGYDYTDSGMAGGNAPKHGLVGLAIEQKKAAVGGDPPDIRNGSVKMVNVGKCGGGIKGYDIHTAADVGAIKNVRIAIERGAGGYTADIHLPGKVEKIARCTLDGSARGYYSILNTGNRVLRVRRTSHSYPPGRQRSKGRVDWR